MSDKIRLFIVDDHQMVREGLRSMLDESDIDIVGEAESGRQAIEKITMLTPEVVLMDIRMPDMDGLEALKQVKALPDSPKVIMVTTYRNTAYLLQSLANGAAGFILKDIPQQDLVATVRSVAGGASQVDHQFLERVLRDLNEQDASYNDGEELSDPLTPREMDVLRLLVEGLSNHAIAEALTLSPFTIKGYLRSVFQKLDVSDRTQAAVKAIRLGLVK